MRLSNSNSASALPKRISNPSACSGEIRPLSYVSMTQEMTCPAEMVSMPRSLQSTLACNTASMSVVPHSAPRLMTVSNSGPES